MSTFIGMKITKECKPKSDSKPKELTVLEIKAKLDDLGIKYDNKAVKADLSALLPQE